MYTQDQIPTMYVTMLAFYFSYISKDIPYITYIKLTTCGTFSSKLEDLSFSVGKLVTQSSLRVYSQ